MPFKLTPHSSLVCPARTTCFLVGTGRSIKRDSANACLIVGAEIESLVLKNIDQIHLFTSLRSDESRADHQDA
jgi:hypothetical protein